jgi:hypothetical protein
LAHQAHVALRTVQQFEAGASTPRRNNLREIVVAFENAGVEFLVHLTRILVLPPPPGPVAIAAD